MPTGVPNKKLKAMLSSNPELRALLDAREELDERIRLVGSREKQRKRLLAYCQRNDLTRKDVTWVHDRLPKLVVTRKDRIAAAAAKKGKEK